MKTIAKIGQEFGQIEKRITELDKEERKEQWWCSRNDAVKKVPEK